LILYGERKKGGTLSSRRGGRVSHLSTVVRAFRDHAASCFFAGERKGKKREGGAVLIRPSGREKGKVITLT